MAKVIIHRSTTKVVRSPKTRTLKRIQRGDPGLPGASSQVISYPAGAALGGHRAVVIESGTAVYADKDTPLHRASVIGITQGAASMGVQVAIQTYGELTEPSWTWTPKQPIFLAANGLLTQTVPTSGFQLILGFAISATTIFIDIKQAIILT